MTAEYQIRRNTVQIQATGLYLETYSFLPNSAKDCTIQATVLHLEMYSPGETPVSGIVQFFAEMTSY